LVLGGRWDYPGVFDDSIVVGLVAVIEESSRGLGDAETDARTWLYLYEGSFWYLIVLDDSDGFVDRIERLDRAHNDALEGVVTDLAKPCLGCRVTRNLR
jgi:hypothetical protein